MAVTIDPRLNLVVPVTDEQGNTSYLHSMPLSNEAFNANYRVIAKAFAQIHADQMMVFGATRVAANVIEDVARKLGVWEGPSGVAASLMAEIRRLTNYIYCTPSGWQTIPYETALQGRMISDDDIVEAEGAICFFILVSAMHRRQMAKATMVMYSDLWGMQMSSLAPMAYAASLQTSTPAGASTKTTSSLPT